MTRGNYGSCFSHVAGSQGGVGPVVVTNHATVTRGNYGSCFLTFLVRYGGVVASSHAIVTRGNYGSCLSLVAVSQGKWVL